MFDENDGIRASQGQTQTTHMGSEKQTIDTRVGVEGLNNGMPFVGIGGTIKSHIGHRWHMLPEEIILNDVDHLLHLTEDQDSMLRESAARCGFRVSELALCIGV